MEKLQAVFKMMCTEPQRCERYTSVRICIYLHVSKLIANRFAFWFVQASIDCIVCVLCTNFILLSCCCHGIKRLLLFFNSSRFSLRYPSIERALSEACHRTKWDPIFGRQKVFMKRWADFDEACTGTPYACVCGRRAGGLGFVMFYYDDISITVNFVFHFFLFGKWQT